MFKKLNAVTFMGQFAAFALPFVFGFCVASGLPLHVVWSVGAAAGKGGDVVDDVSRAGQAV